MVFRLHVVVALVTPPQCIATSDPVRYWYAIVAPVIIPPYVAVYGTCGAVLRSPNWVQDTLGIQIR